MARGRLRGDGAADTHGGHDERVGRGHLGLEAARRGPEPLLVDLEGQGGGLEAPIGAFSRTWVSFPSPPDQGP